jgi:hypothetical protein
LPGGLHATAGKWADVARTAFLRGKQEAREILGVLPFSDSSDNSATTSVIETFSLRFSADGEEDTLGVSVMGLQTSSQAELKLQSNSISFDLYG